MPAAIAATEPSAGSRLREGCSVSGKGTLAKHTLSISKRDNQFAEQRSEFRLRLGIDLTRERVDLRGEFRKCRIVVRHHCNAAPAGRGVASTPTRVSG